ncbi:MULTISPECIES: hypothetical protein [Sphingobacterium]|nr:MULTISPECIES: hypothetical protein [Sphingobacterium]MBL1408837.1 hypothetical protein [Sphingobacterium faecale]
MRLFCTYLLLATLTLQSFYRSIMAMEYQIHLPEYLAKCINKDRPQLHCNGQCVLMKKIREKEKQETKKNLVVYEYSSLYVHKDYTVFQSHSPAEEPLENSFSPYLTTYAFSYRTSVFRPPIA